MHNLSTVFRFEVIRTLKKKSFWLLSLSFPLMIGLIVGIIIFANKATDDALQEAAESSFTIGVTDKSNLLTPASLKAVKATIINSKTNGIAQVENGQLDAYFYYPQHVSTQSVEIYAANVGIFDNGRYEAVASQLLNQSVTGTIQKDVGAVLRDQVSYQSTVYKDGAPYDAFQQLIAPGLFLVLFYFLIAFFGSQMLTSTTEEKENRVIEMILTTVQARTLIIGKILSLVVLGLLQTVIIMTPVIIGYLLFKDQLSLPALDLATIPLDPLRIGFAAVLFLVSFLLFTALLVTVGAAMPTAKEAGSFFGIVMMLLFGPLYAAPLFISSPDAPLVQVLSYFPFTAPIPLMLRNAVGTLPTIEGIIAIAILTLTTVILLRVAVRVFRYGALEYSRKLTLKELFGRG